MSLDDRGRDAGRSLRRASLGVDPPEFTGMRRRRRAARIAGGAALAIVALLAGIGVAALLPDDTPEVIPAGPTTTAGSTTTTPETTGTDSTPTTHFDTTTVTTTIQETTTTTPPAPPGPGGTVVVAGELFATIRGVNDDPPVLNPFLNRFVPGEAWGMGRLVWAGATVVDPHAGEVLPDLVTAVPTLDNGLVSVGADRVDVTFVIRDEAVWEDGTPITAADFLFTHDVITDSSLEINPSWTALHSIAAAVTQGADPKQVVVTLAAPDFRYRYLFPVVLPRHQVEGSDFAEAWNDTFWLSAGPFRFVAHNTDAPAYIQPDEWIFARNPNSFRVDPATGDALPYLDEVIFRYYSRDERGNSRGLRFLVDGEADVHLAVTPFELSAAGIGDERPFVLAQSPILIWEHGDFQFGPTRFEANPESLAEHVRFRQAVARAIDRSAIVGPQIGDPVDSIIELFLPGEDTGVWTELYPWSPTESIELIAALFSDLGRNPGTDPPVLTYDTSFADTTMLIGNLVVEQLQEVGIDARANYGDFFSETFPARKWDFGVWRWVGGRGELDLSGILDVYDPAGPEDEANFGRWEGERASTYSDLIATARATLDDAARLDLWKQAERLLAEDVVLIPLVTRGGGGIVPYRGDRVAGLMPGPAIGGELWGVASWYRADR